MLICNGIPQLYINLKQNPTNSLERNPLTETPQKKFSAISVDMKVEFATEIITKARAKWPLS